MLVRIEALLKIFNQQVTVSQGSPGWAVVRVNIRQLEIVLYGMMVFAIRCTILC
jgi:hypothetical protein